MHRVLVVDDDADIRGLIEFMLRKEGYDVHGVADPLAALELAGTTAFDMAVLDWSMPQMNGGELCARLRELPALSAAPILIVTAHADPAIRSAAFTAGATEYMAKPFSLKQFAGVVAGLLDPSP